MSPFSIVAALVAAHFIGDFPLQGTFLAQMKRQRLYILFAHAFIYAAVLALTLSVLGRGAEWKFAVLLVSHMLIDFWKTRYPTDDAHWHLIYIDQAAHNTINLALWAV